MPATSALQTAPILLSAAAATGGGGPWLETFGRLHVAVVHLPVALLLVAAILELWHLIRRSPTRSPSARTCLVIGAASAVIATATGWIHRGSTPNGDTLVRHQWLGV